MNRLQECKITLAGDTSVGKTALFTSLVNHFRNEKFVDINISSQPTIGAAYMCSSSLLKNRSYGEFACKINWWDTAGHERFRSLTPCYFRGSDLILLCYDLSRIETLNNLYNDENTFSWYNYAKEYSPDTKFLIVGCKCDTVKNEKKVKIENIIHEKCSSLTGSGIRSLSSSIVKTLYGNSTSIVRPLQSSEMNTSMGCVSLLREGKKKTKRTCPTTCTII